MYLTSTDLMLRFRDDVGDPITDVNGGDYSCLWKNREVYAYMTDAADAVATVVGSLTKVLRLPFVAGQAEVRLPRYVLDIREAFVVGTGRPLEHVNANEGFLPACPGEYGHPRRYIRDYTRSTLLLSPVPNRDGVLEIQATTTPTLYMEPDVPLPFQDRKDQLLMLCHMKARAYRKHDAETEDLVRAKEWDAQFDHYARERESQLRRNRRAPGVVKMEW